MLIDCVVGDEISVTCESDGNTIFTMDGTSASLYLLGGAVGPIHKVHKVHKVLLVLEAPVQSVLMVILLDGYIAHKLVLVLVNLLLELVYLD